ncbi:MAG: hypothetical protein ACE15D_10685 [Candidatus Eisenbacteria bacterium]
MSPSRRLLVLFALLSVGLGCSNDSTPPTTPAPSYEAISTIAGQAVQRPFSDYTSTQGTYCVPDGMGGCIDYEPPLKNFVCWSNSDFILNFMFEYLGNADRWLQQESGGAMSLGTDITGNLTERTLPDGRALIHLRVHARNILAWVAEIEDYYLDPLIFGSRVTDVLAGAPPALGDFYMDLDFINPQPGAPIPDLFQLLLFTEPDQEILHATIHMEATGYLHEGSGYPEGTYARVRAVQIFPRAPEGGYEPTGWPVESIDIQPIGN